jgi:hypothetical protein
LNSDDDTNDAGDAPHDPRSALAESDFALVRGLEDLIYVLIQKDVIAFTDLPEPVQQQLLYRARLRARVREDDDPDDSGLIDL